MANPQLKGGYTRIANELVEQLAQINLSAYEWRFLWVLWRKTYGYQKKEDYISGSQFSEITGISKWHISRTKTKLIKRGLVTQRGNKLRFNKDWSEWKRGYPKRQQLPKEATTVTQRGNKKLPKEVDTKEKKETLTKEILIVFNRANEMLNKGNTPYKETPLRKKKITARLKEFSLEDILKAIENCRADKFLQGDNDRGKQYGDLDYVIRSTENIEKLLREQVTNGGYMKVCWKCKGKGHWIKTLDDGTKHKHSCTLCKGTGKIRR